MNQPKQDAEHALLFSYEHEPERYEVFCGALIWQKEVLLQL